MNAFMSFQCPRVNGFENAKLTLVFLVQSVVFFMCLHVSLLRKSLFAKGTFKWPFPSMKSLMLLKISFIVASIGAGTTFEGFYSSVSSFMTSQMRYLPKRFVTKGTLMGFVTCVYAHVQNYELFFLTLILARRTAERIVGLVIYLMAFEPVWRLKDFVTVWTRKRRIFMHSSVF